MGREGGGGYGEQSVRRIPEHLFPLSLLFLGKEYKDLIGMPRKQLPFSFKLNNSQIHILHTFCDKKVILSCMGQK
jgi:hypothetical protein